MRRAVGSAYPSRVTDRRIDLASVGWDESWHDAAAAYSDDWRPARISRVDRGANTVLTETGPIRSTWGSSILAAVAADPLATPCTGDWCLVCCWPDGPVTVQQVLPRRTAVVRTGAGESSRGQVLATNVDVAAVVVGLHPEPNLARIERLLAVAWGSGAAPAVILTKSDMVPDADDVADDVRALAGDVPVITTSIVASEGIDAVRALIGDRGTMALIGASGHGKSSLANAMVGDVAVLDTRPTLDTREIRADGKGRHTSVRRELVLLPGGGAVIDTPGLRGVALHDGGIDEAFPDVASLAADCRFRDCGHLVEPGCAVVRALTDGTLAIRRLESWRQLHAEELDATSRQAARIRRQAGKQWKFDSKQTKARQRAIRRGQF